MTSLGVFTDRAHMRARAREVLQRLPVEPADRPLLHRRGVEAVVEFDGGRVPVQHRPFQAAQVGVHAPLGQPAQQGLAGAQAARLGLYEQVLQIDPGPAPEGRVVVEPQGEAHRLAVRLGDVAEAARVLAEQVAADVGLGGLHRMRQPLVFGQGLDELQDQRSVRGRGDADMDLGRDRGLGGVHALDRLPSPMVTPGGGGMLSGTKKSGISGWVGSTLYLSKSRSPSP